MCVLSLNNCIFACGGNGNDLEELNSVEKYSVETDTWSFACSMKFKRCNFALAACGKYLYAIGGYGPNGVVIQVKYKIICTLGRIIYQFEINCTSY